MKKPLAFLIARVALTAGLFTLPNARAAVGLPYYDSFDYADGLLSTVGSPTWVVGGSLGTTEITVSPTAALTSPPGFPASSNKGVRRAPSSTARRSILQFSSVPAADGSTVYASFLLEVQTPPPTASQVIGCLDSSASQPSSPQCGVFLDSTSRLGIGKKTSNPGFTMATNLGPGTHLVVARYTFQLDYFHIATDPGISGTLEIPPGTDILDANLNPPPYTYTLDPASIIPFYVQTYGGAGKGPFAP
jgi:hypothetical protein